MPAIWAILLNTCREIVRQRLFALIILINTAVITLLLIFPYFATNQETDMFKDLAPRTAALAMVFLVAISASSGVAEELESKTALTVLAKPVSRTHFLIGKYLGVALAMLAAVAIMAAILFLMTYLRVYFDAPRYDRHLAFTLAPSQPAREFQALMWNQAATTLPDSVMIFYQAAVLAAVAVVLSACFSRVLAVIVTFGLFLVAPLSEFLLVSVREAPQVLRLGVSWAVNLLPQLQTFDIFSHLSHRTLVAGSADFASIWSYTGLSGLYALGYIVFIMLLGSLLFRHREIG